MINFWIFIFLVPFYLILITLLLSPQNMLAWLELVLTRLHLYELAHRFLVKVWPSLAEQLEKTRNVRKAREFWEGLIEAYSRLTQNTNVVEADVIRCSDQHYALDEFKNKFCKTSRNQFALPPPISSEPEANVCLTPEETKQAPVPPPRNRSKLRQKVLFKTLPRPRNPPPPPPPFVQQLSLQNSLKPAAPRCHRKPRAPPPPPPPPPPPQEPVFTSSSVKAFPNRSTLNRRISTANMFKELKSKLQIRRSALIVSSDSDSD